MPEAILTPHEQLGGDAGVVRLVERFYERMDAEPEAATIRALHADELAPMVDKLSVFLIGWLGGPASSWPSKPPMREAVRRLRRSADQ